MSRREHRIFDEYDEEPPNLSFILSLVVLTVLPLIIVLVLFLFIR